MADWPEHRALDSALITEKKLWPTTTRQKLRAILERFVGAGGSVVISSHVMALVEQVCDHVGVIAGGRLVASGTLDQVRDGGSLDDAFVRLVGGHVSVEGLSWLES